MAHNLYAKANYNKITYQLKVTNFLSIKKKKDFSQYILERFHPHLFKKKKNRNTDLPFEIFSSPMLRADWKNAIFQVHFAKRIESQYIFNVF